MGEAYSKPVVTRRLAEEELHPGAVKIWRAQRNKGCDLCPLSKFSKNVCVYGNGAIKTGAMIVGEAPWPREDTYGRVFIEPPGMYLRSVLEDVGLDPDNIYLTNSLKCVRPKDTPKTEVTAAKKACATYLEQELMANEPRVVLAMGETAFYYFTHKPGGITKARGKAFQWPPPWGGEPITVVPTLDPMAVLDNPANHVMFYSDVEKFAHLYLGTESGPKINVIEVHSIDDYRAAMQELEEDDGKLLTFDLETRGFVDFKLDYARVWMAAFTRGRKDPDGKLRVFAIPIEHPQAEWVENERMDQLNEVIRGVIRLVLRNPVNGHNVKFDVRSIKFLARKYGLPEAASAYRI